MNRSSRVLSAAALSFLVAACQSVPPPRSAKSIAAPSCSTASVSIAFDFEGASPARCTILGDRAFSILVTPERAPPINPSPWYAFRYDAKPGGDVTITLNYLYGEHRYPPKLTANQRVSVINADVAEDKKSVRIVVPAGQAIISAEEIFDSARYDGLYRKLTNSIHVKRARLGLSHDGRPIEALRMGDPKAPHLIVLLGRAHPPEVSGAVAMEAFLEQLATLYDGGVIDAQQFQVIAVPMLNPDGVYRGHWRANLSGLDLNRDWDEFSQPETRAVAAFLDTLGPDIKPVVMIDFHSTRDNLFYVQSPNESDVRQERFLDSWLGGNLGKLDGYPFAIVRTDANPGSGTSKNWFHARYGIPAYTYEVGDETDRNATALAARQLAAALVPAINAMLITVVPARS